MLRLSSVFAPSLVLLVLSGCQCAPPVSPGCTSNVDCPSSQVCNTVDDTCVGCLTDGQCESGLCLPDHTCSQCGPNTPCGQGMVCGADGTCKNGCETSTAGCPPGSYCLAGSSTCVACLYDSHCGQGAVCDPNTNQCRPGCSPQNPTCAPGLVCDTAAGACVGCLANVHCPAQQPACNPATQTCVGCLSNASCGGATPFCDVANQICVQCLTDPQCAAGKVCTAGTCTPGCSAANPACPAGQICKVAAGQCVQCIDDAQCGGATPRCETTTNRCVACLPGANDNCPVNQYCRPDFVCERGCKTGADCPSGVCLPDHSCSMCTMDNQCAAGQVCQGGTCTAACGAANPCGAGKQCCEMRCVDFTNDRNNCGACGNVCGAGQSCCNGTCSGLNTNNNCGACGTTCGAGTGCCGNTCRSTTTLTDCGGCGITCTANQFCDGTMCRNITFPEFCANSRVYVIYDGIANDDAATNMLASTIATNCPTTTIIEYGPQSNPAWVDQTTGALLFGGGSTVVTAGGPFANKPVKWMERTSQTTKVYFHTNGIDTFSFKRRSDDLTLVSQPASSCSSHHDVLLVELARDPSSGTLALIAYGVCGGGYGTQAAGWYYANVMLPNRTAYPDSWYLFEWNDTNNDSLPNAGDSFVRITSGL
ncbi:MAG: hypothetical protein JNK82_01340 [Myxococcaceae bacterium]|nr:hypothetical protein [Myxococcaceae bacterium]